MNKKTLIIFLLATLLLLDLGYSFMQYVNYPTDGDMPSHLIPEEGFQKVIDNPLGIRAFSDELAYPDPNRFFMHYPYYVIMNGLPKLISNFTNPVNAIYISMAIVKITVHFLLLFLIAAFVNGGIYLREKFFWFSLIMISAFFNANVHSPTQVGIVDSSVTYLFAYSFQMIFVMLFFLPLVLKHHFKKATPILDKWKLLWIPLALAINLGSPLTPGIIMVVVFVYAIYHTVKYLKSNNKGLSGYFRSIPSDIYFYLIPATIFAIYSFILGMYNGNTMLYADQMTIAGAYKLLPYGIYNQFILNKGYLTLVLVLFIGYLILLRVKDQDVVEYRKLWLWAMLFIVMFIALLPLGGYKPYRPYSLRYDTVVPVTLIMIILFGRAIKLLKEKGFDTLLQCGYAIVCIVVVGWLYKRDVPEFFKNDAEKEALMTIAAADDPVVEIANQKGTILNWTVIEDPEQSIQAGQLLQIWGVTKEPKKFYQTKSEE